MESTKAGKCALTFYSFVPRFNEFSAVYLVIMKKLRELIKSTIFITDSLKCEILRV